MIKWKFKNKAVHGEMNKLFLFPSLRCEFVGSSGGCSSGQGVRDVCDCAQEGQLEVSSLSVFLSFLSLWLFSSLLSPFSFHLCISKFFFFLFLCCPLSVSLFLLCNIFSDLFVCLRGEAFAVWHWLRMRSKEWIIIIYSVSMHTFMWWLIQQRSVNAAKFLH